MSSPHSTNYYSHPPIRSLHTKTQTVQPHSQGTLLPSGGHPNHHSRHSQMSSRSIVPFRSLPYPSRHSVVSCTHRYATPEHQNRARYGTHNSREDHPSDSARGNGCPSQCSRNPRTPSLPETPRCCRRCLGSAGCCLVEGERRETVERLGEECQQEKASPQGEGGVLCRRKGEFYA